MKSFVRVFTQSRLCAQYETVGTVFNMMASLSPYKEYHPIVQCFLVYLSSSVVTKQRRNQIDFRVSLVIK